MLCSSGPFARSVPVYPVEDSEVRILDAKRTRGGNATNSLAIAAQLGARCTWIGTLADPSCDADAEYGELRCPCRSPACPL